MRFITHHQRAADGATESDVKKRCVALTVVIHTRS
jgi:hypothetical protein